MAVPRGYVSPSSRRARLARLLHAEPRARTDGLTFAEIVERYREAHPEDRAATENLKSAVGALIHDAMLVRTGVRRRRTVYAYRGRGGPSLSEERLAALRDAIVEVVEVHSRVEGTPMATGAVREALKSRGLWPDRFGRLSLLLTGLTGTRYGAPRLQSIVSRTANGRTARFWLSNRAPTQSAPAPATRAEALRRAVGAAADQLGRPVSKREIGWWLDAQPAGSPLRAALDGTALARVLKNATDHDALHAGTPGHVHAVEGPLTCYGGAPTRYLLRPPTSDEVTACRIEDALLAVRPAEELAAVARLEGLADARRSAPLLALARARRALVVAALRRYADPDGVVGHRAVRRGLMRERAAIATLARFVADSSAAYGARYSRDAHVEALRAELDAAWEPLATSSRDEAAQPRFVGRAALVSARDVRDFATRAVTSGEAPAGRPHALYASARRFPVDRVTIGSPPARRGADELAQLDRPDAILGVFSRVTGPATRRLIESANAVLGLVLRDAAFLRTLLDEISPADRDARAIRRALVVSLALLGDCPSLRRAVPEPSDSRGTAAYVVAVVAGELELERVYECVRSADARATGRARGITARALSALRGGRLLTAIEA